jgi:LPS sulfotransferase NodH
MGERFGFGETVRDLKWAWRGRLARLMQPKAPEEAFLETYIPELRRRRTAGGVFAAKVHYAQYERVLDNPVGHALLEGGVFVSLVREDLLGQALSLHVSNLTGRWSIDETVTTAPSQSRNYFDNDAIDACVTSLADEDNGWRMFFARNGIRPLFLTYESFRADPWRDVDAIARALGIDPAALPHDYVERDMPAEFPPEVPDRRKIRASFLERPGRIVPADPAR